MLYLSPPTGSPAVHDAMRAGLLGLVTTPDQGNDLTSLVTAGVPYACDNGRFGKGWPGPAAWAGWLRRTVKAYGRPLFAVVPDVPYDAAGTRHWWSDHAGTVTDTGVPRAFAAQDGCESGLVPWQDLTADDVLFLAGTTEWKLGASARALVGQALDRGLRVHMGRVNSEERIVYAASIGCTWADGTLLTYGPDANLPDVLAWNRRLGTYDTLFDLRQEGVIP